MNTHQEQWFTYIPSWSRGKSQSIQSYNIPKNKLFDSFKREK